jgi:hypothetical protein
VKIGFGPWYDCSSLDHIVVHPANSFYTSIEGVVFDRSLAEVIQFPPGRAGSYDVLSSVTNIAREAFRGCRRLASIAIPEGVALIDHYAFSDCTALTRLNLPSSVRIVGDYAFRGCSELSVTYIPRHITSIGYGSFSECIALRSVFFLGDEPQWVPDVFASSGGVVSYYLPGASGWAETYGDRPVKLWDPHFEQLPGLYDEASCGRLVLMGEVDIPIVVETSTDIVSGEWSSLPVATLTNGILPIGHLYGDDGLARFFRVRSP